MVLSHSDKHTNEYFNTDINGYTDEYSNTD
jgi:hypothetical protein